jgi:hypothetical protein
MEAYVILGLFAAALFALVLFCVYYYRQEAKELRRELEEYRKTYLRCCGWIFTHGSYHIRSFDGGKMWYAAEETNCGLKILGRAEDVYSFLRKPLDCPREANSGGRSESQKDVLKTTDRPR